MTATDELRRLLDERGVEWIGTSFSKPAKGHPTNTSLGEEHHEATFIEYDDGNVLRLFDLTPAQAVDATLGRGACSLVREYFGQSGNWYRLVCSECHHVIYDGWQEKPRYCPFCGSRVVDA